MSAASATAAPKDSSAIELDAKTLLNMSLYEMKQKGIDPCNQSVRNLIDDYYKKHFVNDSGSDTDSDDSDDEKTDDDEAGLMDYRDNEIIVVEKDRRITIILEFTFNQHYDCAIPVSEDFEEKRCAKYDAKEIAFDAIGEEYEILDAFWSGNKLHIIINNMDEYYNVDELDEMYRSNSLEDGPYEAAPGESFWVVSYGDIQDSISEE